MSNKRARLMREVHREAAHGTLGIRLNINPIDALQEVLDRAVALLRHYADEADNLAEDKLLVDTAFGRMPHHWVRLEQDARAEVERIAGGMVRNGIADRAVKVQEAKAILMVQAIVAAAEEVGIPRAQVRALGPAVRQRLLALEEAA